MFSYSVREIKILDNRRMSFQVGRGERMEEAKEGGRGTEEEEEEEEGTAEMVVAQKKQTTLPIENTNI